MFRLQIQIIELCRGCVIKIGEGRQSHRLGRTDLEPQPTHRTIASRKTPQGRSPIRREAHPGRTGNVETLPLFDMPQPEISHVTVLGMGIFAVRSRKRLAEIGAVNVVEGIIAAERGRTRPPVVIRPQPGTDVVGIVAVHHRAARPVVTVEILAVADRRIERETPDGFHPSQRREHRRSMLELIGIVRGIETVRTERPVLITGLEIEKSGLFTVVVHPQVTVVVLEIGVVDIPVAATVRPGGKKGKTSLGHGPREIAVRIAVVAARRLDAQIAGFERHRADIQGPCIRTDARYAVDQIDSRDAIYVDRQRMRLMTRSGIRKVNTVEHDHRLVEGTSPDHNVRLRSPAAPFPKIDRRAQTQHRLEGLDRRRSTRLSIENGGGRHRTARGGSFHPRHLDLFDLQLSGDRKRIDGLRLHGRRRGQENGGHRNREDSDGNLAPKARESGVTLATPAPEARSTLCLDLFHPVKIKVINNIGLGSSVAELRPVGVQR